MSCEGVSGVGCGMWGERVRKLWIRRDSYGMTNDGEMNSVAIFYHKVHGERVK